MNKRKFFMLAIGIIALLVFQAKVIMPAVHDVAASGLFLKGSKSEPNRMSSDTIMIDNAFNQCNTHISTNILPDTSISFTKKPIGAFSLGNYEFVINAEAEITPPNEPTYTKKYVCKIQYLSEDNASDMANSDNWSVSGLSELSI